MGKTKYIETEAFKRRILSYGTPIPFYKRYLADAYVALLRWVCEEVDDTPAADIPQWIPVTERLPEEDYETGNGVQFSADVLATIVNHANDGELYCWLLKTVDGKWYDYVPNWDGEHEIPHWCEVIAWMPLPEPYKEGEGE